MSALLIYIHGFLSSPLSQKAVELQDHIRRHALPVATVIPELSNYPREAYAQLQQLLEQSQAEYQRIGLVGSSMGGFYATGLAEQFGLKAVLVNPAVTPDRLMADYLGEHENPYTGQRFYLSDKDVEDLRAMTVSRLSRPGNCWLMVQQGDETLDYRAAVEFYADSPQLVEEAGSHRFDNFEKHLPEVMKFLELV